MRAPPHLEDPSTQFSEAGLGVGLGVSPETSGVGLGDTPPPPEGVPDEEEGVGEGVGEGVDEVITGQRIPGTHSFPRDTHSYAKMLSEQTPVIERHDPEVQGLGMLPPLPALRQD